MIFVKQNKALPSIPMSCIFNKLLLEYKFPCKKRTSKQKKGIIMKCSNWLIDETYIPVGCLVEITTEEYDPTL